MHKASDVQPLGVEDAISFCPRCNGCNGSEREPDAQPAELLNMAEAFNDGALDYGDDGGVKAVEEGRRVDGENDEEPLEGGVW